MKPNVFSTKRSLSVIAVIFMFGSAALYAVEAVTWDSRAASLGCPHKVSSQESPDKSQLVMNYLPEGQTVKHYRKAYVVTLIRIPTDEADARKAIAGIIPTYATQLQKGGAVVKTWTLGSGNLGAVVYGEYTVNGEWNSMAIGRTAPGIATIHRLYGKTGAPTTHQVKIIKDMVGL